MRQSTLSNFTEKKNLSKLSKYLTDRDQLAALTLQNNRDRHTKHLKRDEVAADTVKLRSSNASALQNLQNKDTN